MPITRELLTCFMCSGCDDIVHAMEFKIRILEDGLVVVKWGSMDIQIGKRVDYMSSHELHHEYWTPLNFDDFCVLIVKH